MEVTLGGIAGLVAACALLILVGATAVLLVKVGKVVDELGSAVKELTVSGTPILHELKGTVVSVNDELVKVGVVTDDVAKVTGAATSVASDASQLSTLVAATLGGPLVKLSAFSYGVRRAIASVRKKG